MIDGSWASENKLLGMTTIGGGTRRALGIRMHREV